MNRIKVDNGAASPIPIYATKTKIEVYNLSTGRIIIGDQGTGPAPTPPPSLISSPVLTGIVRVGQTLSVTSGVWSDADTFAYQWTLDGVDIPGETSSTYLVTSAAMASQITCEVIATGPGGVSDPADSNSLESVWRPILQILGGDGYLYVFTPSETGVSIGSPVSSVYDVAHQEALVQPITASQPVQQSDCVFFTLDDYLTGDQANIVRVFNRPNPAPLTAMITITTAVNDGNQVLFAASATGVTNRNIGLTSQARAVGRSASARFVATTVPAHKPLWVIDAVPLTSQATRILDTTVSTDGYLGGVDTADNFTLGGRRRVNIEFRITNGIKCLLLCTRALDASERAVIRGVLDAQGVTL